MMTNTFGCSARTVSCWKTLHAIDATIDPKLQADVRLMILCPKVSTKCERPVTRNEYETALLLGLVSSRVRSQPITNAARANEAYRNSVEIEFALWIFELRAGIRGL